MPIKKYVSLKSTNIHSVIE